MEEHQDDDIRDFRSMTPTRVLQIRFIGFINALFNYLQWLMRQDNARKDDES